MLLCGDYRRVSGMSMQDDEYLDAEAADYVAMVARIDNDGTLAWNLQISGSNLSGGANQDHCKGVTYSAFTLRVAILIQGKMYGLRQSPTEDVFDAILLLTDLSGNVQFAMSIT